MKFCNPSFSSIRECISFQCKCRELRYSGNFLHEDFDIVVRRVPTEYLPFPDGGRDFGLLLLILPPTPKYLSSFSTLGVEGIDGCNDHIPHRWNKHDYPIDQGFVLP